MSERRAVIRQAAAGYHKISKMRGGQWLDELMALSGYHPWYAVRFVAYVGLRARRGRRSVYDAPVLKALRRVWARRFWVLR